MVSLLGIAPTLAVAQEEPAPAAPEPRVASGTTGGGIAPSNEPPEPSRDDRSGGFAQGSRPAIAWPAHYRRFGWVDGVVSGAFGAAAVTVAVVGPRLDGPTGGVLFDDGARHLLRPDEYRGRLLAADLSDVFLGFGASYAFMGDPLVNAGWLRDSKEVGQQLFLLNAEVAAVTLGLQQVVANTVSRERPYGRVCGTDELDSRTINCEGDDRYRSHFSGHTAFTFAMAAATCTHHSYLPLSGNKRWLTCALGFSNAAATAMLRVVADKHYVSDIIVGAAAGSLIGWGLPFLHYSTGLSPLSSQIGEVRFMLMPTMGGATLYGVMP